MQCRSIRRQCLPGLASVAGSNSRGSLYAVWPFLRALWQRVETLEGSSRGWSCGLLLAEGNNSGNGFCAVFGANDMQLPETTFANLMVRNSTSLPPLFFTQCSTHVNLHSLVLPLIVYARQAHVHHGKRADAFTAVAAVDGGLVRRPG